MIERSPGFTNFSKHLSALSKEADKEYQEYFQGIEDKIAVRGRRIKKRQAKHENKKSDLSAHKNGIEGRQDLIEEQQEHDRDMVDLSLLPFILKGIAAELSSFSFRLATKKIPVAITGLLGNKQVQSANAFFCSHRAMY